MENKMKIYLGENYSDNHILNFLKYWQGLTNPRIENDLDCLYLNGDLCADTILSVFFPMKMVVEYLNPGLIIHKRYKGDTNKDLRFLQKSIKNNEILFMDHDLVKLLNKFAEFAETRANTIKIPNRKMQNRNRYDQFPNMLYNCFEDGKFHQYFVDSSVEEWLEREKLQMFFRDDQISTRNNIKPLIHSIEPYQVRLLKKEDEIIEMLTQNCECLEKRLSLFKSNENYI